MASEVKRLRAELASLKLQLAYARATIRATRQRCPFCGAPCGRRGACRSHRDLLELERTT